ncbi:universal stress protein [Nonlabens ulvanivorans]|uniref:universal stress protein n=1 Tax=Nonlabens ulvanivorans TaxID=906888 RepID=UPI002943F459|nr:universal stress protein [Nonlabens ulvanivorans]WOI21513.1 universal stress protein [Nonlabens ulvanivorans]
MKHILIPVDNTDPSWTAAHCTISMYRDAGICFYLLPASSLKPIDDDASKALIATNCNFKERVEALELLIAPHQKIIGLSLEGSFITQVKEAVHDNDIDLIVCTDVFHATHNGQIDAIHTKAIITRIKCPVLIVPHDFKCKPLEQVVLLSDFNFTHRSKATNTITDFVDRSQTHLNILQLQTSNAILTQSQVENKSFLKTALEQFSCSFHSVINKTMDDALQLFVSIHQVELVILFAKNINFLENILFSSEHYHELNYRKKVPFLIIHE